MGSLETCLGLDSRDGLEAHFCCVDLEKNVFGVGLGHFFISAISEYSNRSSSAPGLEKT